MTTVSNISDIPDVIQAKVFQLVDDNGDVRAELKTDVDGEPSFTLMDKQGQPRLIARLDGDNSFKEVDAWSGEKPSKRTKSAAGAWRPVPGARRPVPGARRPVHGKALYTEST